MSTETTEDRGDNLELATEGTQEVDAGTKVEIDKIEAEKTTDVQDKANEADSTTEDAGGSSEEGEQGKNEKPKKDTRIPLARHQAMLDKVRNEREALIAENARLRQNSQSTKINESIDDTEVKLVEMEVEYNELLGKGELKDAAKLMTEIRRMERTVSDTKADVKAKAAADEAYERVKYDATLNKIEEAYPELNVDSEEYNEEKTEEVLGLFSSFVRDGLDRTTAMQKAVKYVMGSATSKEKQATEVTEENDKLTPEQIAQQRKQDALKRNIDAANRQPANVSKLGIDSDKGSAKLTGKDAISMSQTSFDKLTEEELSKIRGDSV